MAFDGYTVVGLLGLYTCVGFGLLTWWFNRLC